VQFAGRNKVLSTKVSIDLHNRFSLLAEYLSERGLSEGFTPSALLHDIIEQLHIPSSSRRIRSPLYKEKR
jgi:hypothetical protein